MPVTRTNRRPIHVACSLLILLNFTFLPAYSQAADAQKESQYSNRLKYAISPYLLQHADNPVEWYPWGDEAFEKAAKEDKPIFLSIGYSTCHWCHVMEHESFEDPEIAKLMNDTFVSIKVDREERPDIDGVYMKVCQMLRKQGCGWPLTIIMTPDKKPFFAATYIPKGSRFGRTGMFELIPSVEDLWKTDRDRLLTSADKVTDALEESARQSGGGDNKLDTSTLDLGYKQLENVYDADKGGFGRAPKFPSPHNLLFLLRYWDRTGNEKALGMVEKTLQEMRRGGIYDHVGFGFHRYSTDNDWLLPHFEKMLYDQAMLAMAYTEAYQATGNVDYMKTAREIFAYVLRDMTDSRGGFYSAEDADSEGEEGKFYVWTEGEIEEVLGKDRADFIIKVYNAEESGNFREEASGKGTGSNILYLRKPLPEVASSFGLSEEELENKINSSREKLFAAREKRVHPHKDDKVLTDWNGLMIAALAKAGRAFNDPEYTKAAARAADFILTEMRTQDGGLLHSYRNGKAGTQAHVDDYAFLAWGLIELYESSFDIKYLESALEINDGLIKNFWDEKDGGFYFTSHDGEELLVRDKEIYDGAIPSGNSVAVLNLIRLGRITAKSSFDERAASAQKAFSNQLGKAPGAFTFSMSALDFGLGPSYEVVIVGAPEAKDTGAMLEALRKHYVPRKVVILRPPGESPEITKIADFTKSQQNLDGKATAYVCKNYVCNLPTTDIDKMLEQLNIQKDGKASD